MGHTVPVLFIVLMCQDSITGIVVLPITVPVMVKSVTIPLLVFYLENLPYG